VVEGFSKRYGGQGSGLVRSAQRDRRSDSP
jgi:hypothetical protein